MGVMVKCLAFLLQTVVLVASPSRWLHCTLWRARPGRLDCGPAGPRASPALPGAPGSPPAATWPRTWPLPLKHRQESDNGDAHSLCVLLFKIVAAHDFRWGFLLQFLALVLVDMQGGHLARGPELLISSPQTKHSLPASVIKKRN